MEKTIKIKFGTSTIVRDLLFTALIYNYIDINIYGLKFSVYKWVSHEINQGYFKKGIRVHHNIRPPRFKTNFDKFLHKKIGHKDYFELKRYINHIDYQKTKDKKEEAISGLKSFGYKYNDAKEIVKQTEDKIIFIKTPFKIVYTKYRHDLKKHESGIRLFWFIKIIKYSWKEDYRKKKYFFRFKSIPNPLYFTRTPEYDKMTKTFSVSKEYMERCGINFRNKYCIPVDWELRTEKTVSNELQTYSNCLSNKVINWR